MKIGMIGLGKLGKPVAEVMASGGNFWPQAKSIHKVYGYDITDVKPKGVTTVKSISELLDKNLDIVFVAVPTPHDPAYEGDNITSNLPPKDFDYSIVEEVFRKIAKKIRKLSEQPIVVLISTCLPGTVRWKLNPILAGVKLIYNPYFIAMGTVKEDFVSPEFLLLGTETGEIEGGQVLIDFYDTLFESEKIVLTWDEAEATKVFYNTFISMKLGFVNMIQDVAMGIGNIDTDKVTEALGKGTDRLISTAYMKAGMGDGGACHPRDNIALSSLSKRLNLGYDFFGSIMKAREKQAENLAIFLMKQKLPIIIMGKTYKAGVPYIDGSYSVLIENILRDKYGVEIAGYIDHDLDIWDEEEGPYTYLIAHPTGEHYVHPFKHDSIIVDPWRDVNQTACEFFNQCKVIRYGKTR